LRRAMRGLMRAVCSRPPFPCQQERAALRSTHRHSHLRCPPASPQARRGRTAPRVAAISLALHRAQHQLWRSSWQQQVWPASWVTPWALSQVLPLASLAWQPLQALRLPQVSVWAWGLLGVGLRSGDMHNRTARCVETWPRASVSVSSEWTSPMRGRFDDAVFLSTRQDVVLWSVRVFVVCENDAPGFGLGLIGGGGPDIVGTYQASWVIASLLSISPGLLRFECVGPSPNFQPPILPGPTFFRGHKKGVV
jgi:hypothetical protein